MIILIVPNGKLRKEDTGGKGNLKLALMSGWDLLVSPEGR
jgi:hypothetical protein